ncbi:MAG: putative thiol peroxidase [Vicingaceae bacterium]|nr:MAG: putative thiol peroxidase [Bacteroidia bacterium]GIV30560.1 MAG: putative thiol peroxidase [Bacteroidia bacterium]GIV41095.1 MAG: putative thiol peroxidase [Vicingaceae bacterium]
MIKVNFKGNPVSLKASVLPTTGNAAPNIRWVTASLSEENLYDVQGKKVLIFVPSLDTGVCATETKKFNEKLGQKNGVTGIVISMDLPFAQKRFCEAEGVNNVKTVSDFRYKDAAEKFGLEMTDGPLKGLLARAVFIVDESNKIAYVQLVPEITSEPDYEDVLKHL